MRTAQHKINRKIKEIGASMWASLLLLYFSFTPNLTYYYLQVLFTKHRTFWICGLLGNDQKQTKYSHEDQSVSTVESQGQSTSNQHFKILRLIAPNCCLVSWVRDIIPWAHCCCQGQQWQQEDCLHICPPGAAVQLQGTRATAHAKSPESPRSALKSVWCTYEWKLSFSFVLKFWTFFPLTLCLGPELLGV